MLKLIIFLLLLYAGIVLFLFLFQRQFIYFPNNHLTSPENANVPDMQVVTLHTDDELDLMAWYRPPTLPQRPTIIYFHGNAGNIGHRGIIVKPFLQKGFGVLLVTYRGYSGNPGKPDEKGLYKDGRAALTFLHERGIPGSCIVLYGESIGSAVAIQMAVENPVAALILQSPFPSLASIGQFHYPWFPVKWLMKDQYNVINKINAIHAHTLVIYGIEDDIIPPKFSIELYDKLPAQKKIKPMPSLGHNDLYDPSFAIRFIDEYVTCNIKK